MEKCCMDNDNKSIDRICNGIYSKKNQCSYKFDFISNYIRRYLACTNHYIYV